MMEISIKLEQECNCRYRFNTDSYPDKECPDCHGTGMCPTDFGQELLDFVEKYAKKKETKPISR